MSCEHGDGVWLHTYREVDPAGIYRQTFDADVGPRRKPVCDDRSRRFVNQFLPGRIIVIQYRDSGLIRRK